MSGASSGTDRSRSIPISARLSTSPASRTYSGSSASPRVRSIMADTGHNGMFE